MHRFVWGSMTLVLTAMVIVAAIERHSAIRWLSVGAAFTVLSAICLMLNRRGSTRLAARLVLTGLAVILTCLAATGGGIHAPAVTGYLIVILAAGLMLGVRSGLLAAIACMLIELLFAFLASQYHYFRTPRSYGPYSLWIVHVMYAGLLFVSVVLFTDRIAKALQAAKRELTARVTLAYRLQERLKELTALRGVASVLQRGVQSRDVLLSELVPLLPLAMEFPERAAARIRVGDDEASTPGFRQTSSMLRVDFTTAQGEVGSIEVMYSDSGDGSGSPAFLAEEQAMIHTVAEMLHVDFDRQQAERELRESETRYRELIESARDVIFTIEPDGTFQSLNQSFETILGWSRAEWIGRRFAEIIHPDDRPFAQRMFQTVLDGSLPPVHEIRTVRSSGTYAVCEVTVAPRSVQGQVVAILGIARDISERKALEEQLRRNQRVESIGTLASGIAHDLNNVLAPLLLSLEMLERRSDEKSKATIALLRKGTLRGTAIVKQVLAFARGNEDESYAPQQMRYVIDEVVTLVRQTFPKNIDVLKHVAADLPLIRGDTTQIHQIVMNLCVNARDAMPDGGRLTISVARVTAESGAAVRLTVTDTGCGMTPEVRERIFEPFFTTKGVGKGTGLGLSTVYSIVRNHRATIDVNSEPGKGTEFSITFPAIAETAPEPEIVQDQPLPRGSGERILIVDDEPAILRIAQDALFAYGYIADTAHDGEEASRMVSAHPPGTYALVVTDSQMPRMSGLDSAILMRRHDPALHIVICSGSSVSASPELSPVAYLAKPFNEEELVTLIHRLLHPA